MRSHTLPAMLCGGLFILGISQAAAEQCSADCTHATRACVCAIDGTTGSVLVTSLGEVRRTPVQLRQALEVGDEISSDQGNAILALTCPGGSDVTLHGRFRALIMPPVEGQDCVLNLLAGGADVMTSVPTELRSGEIVMGSQRTVYGMRVSREDAGTSVACLVFDGRVQAESLATRKPIQLGTLEMARWSNGRRQPDVRVLPGAIEAASLVYARADLARARAHGATFAAPDQMEGELQQRHAAVLVQPSNPQARIELASLQVRLRAPRQALYHLAKAEALQPASVDQRVAIAAAKFQALRQVGRESEAAAEAEKGRRLDQRRFDRLIQIR